MNLQLNFTSWANYIISLFILCLVLMKKESSLNSNFQLGSQLLASQQIFKSPSNSSPLKKSSDANFQQVNQINLNLSSTILQKQLPQKKYVHIKEFQYGQFRSKTNKKISRQSEKANSQFLRIMRNQKFDKIPIKIVKDKFYQEQIKNQRSLNHNTKMDRAFELYSESNPESENEQINNKIKHVSASANFKLNSHQLYELKKNSFKPKLRIFQRFNYQNYQNYNYKNPFKKYKYESIAKTKLVKDKFDFPKNSKYELNKGSTKNLQIIFCQTKYPDFVKKTNEIYQKQQLNPASPAIPSILSLSKNFSGLSSQNLTDEQKLNFLKINIREEMTARSRDLINSKNAIKWQYKPPRVKSSSQSKSQQKNLKLKLLLNQKVNSRSTLEKNLEQFKTLEKLTVLNLKQQQQKIRKKKQASTISEDISKTALASLLISKFSFLENLNKFFRQHLLKVLFEFQSVNEYTKISIHDYLKFNRIFITKDSQVSEVSLFILNLLYKNAPEISFQVGSKVLSQLNPKKYNKYQKAIKKLFQICQQSNQVGKPIIEIFQENIGWVWSIIDLIKNQ